MPDTDAPVPLDALLAHREWVRRMAASLARDGAEADDLAQEAWVVAIEHPPRHATSIRGWFAGLLRHRLLNRRRGDARRVAREEATPRRAAPDDPSQVVAHAELHRQVVDAVLALDEPYRTTVLLRFFEDLPPAEIARRLGVPLETVRSRLHRAVVRLRERLDAEHDGHRAAWLVPLVGWSGIARDGGVAAGSAAAGAGKTAAVAAGGGIVAGTGTKLCVAAAALALLAGNAWWLATRSADPRPAAQRAALDGTDSSAVPRPGRAARPGGSPAMSGDDAAQGTAFDGVDRERDLHGRVVDRDGRPVGGAGVQSFRRLHRDIGAGSAWKRPQSDIPGPAATSAADGTFAVRLAPGEVVDLVISARGFAARHVPAVAAGERIEVVVDEGARLTVTVTAAAGAPVGGAQVDVLHGAWMWGRTRQAATGRTGADGRVTIALPAGGDATVLATADRFAPAESKKVAVPDVGEATVTVELPQGIEVTGHVLDFETSAPIPSAAVLASPLVPTPVAADGSFRVVASPRELRIAAKAPGWIMRAESVVAGAPTEIRLRRGIVVRGRVIDPSGAPVSGAFALAAGGSMDAVATAGTDGRFEIHGVEGEETLAFAFWVPGRARVLLDATMPARGEFDLGDVVLPEGRSIAGVVLAADGSALRRAAVSISGENADRASRHAADWPPASDRMRLERFSDDLGRFVFTDLPAGDWHVEARPTPQEVVARDVRLGADADVTDVVLSFGEVTRFTARVRDEAGNPVAGAVVSVQSISGSIRKCATDGSGTATAEVPGKVHGASVASRTADGRALRAIDPPMRLSGATEAEFVVREEAWISGHVEDAEGRPVASCEVVCIGANAETFRGDWSRADGGFDIVVPRDVVFDVECAGGRRGGPSESWTGSVRGVAAGTTDVTLRVGPGPASASVSFRAVTADGEPLADVPITLQPESGDTAFPGRTDATGRLRLDDVPARVLLLVVGEWGRPDSPWRVAGWIEPQGWMRVRPRGQEVVLRFRRAGRATGRISMPTGWETVVAPQIVAKSGGRVVASTQAAPDGTFTMPLPLDEPGPFTISFGARRMADNRSAEGEVRGVRQGDTGIELVVREVK